MAEVITSVQNPIIKKVKSLHEKSKRDKLGQFFVEGLRIVKDALDSGAKIDSVLVSDGEQKGEMNELLDIIQQRGILVYTISEKLFKEISDTQTPQGILAIINKREANLDEVTNIENAFLVLLENVQDPGNMGTVIRTADAAGAAGVIVSKGSVDFYNPKVLRSTMGSIFHLPIIKADDFNELIDKLKSSFNIYAAHLDGKVNHFDADMKQKTAVIIGNEANGISNEVAGKCKLIKIPMIGKSESLNASVSAAVIMYECVRQRLG